MYFGHAALALVLKARAPQVPIVPLTLACYGPDWIDAMLMLPTPRNGMAPYSHSLPALLIGALLASGTYVLFARRPGAWQIFIAWGLHWPLDLITGVKPIVGVRPVVGLDLYHVPWVDAVVECVVIIAACLVYMRALAPRKDQRRVVIALGSALLIGQLCFDSVLRRLDGQPWRPSLALAK